MFLLFEIFIFINSKELLKEERITIYNCLYSYLPSMFFSIFICNYLSLNNLYNYIPRFIINLFRKFNINKKEIEILFLSVISGYPNNIRLLNKSNNEYLLYVSNFINPIFFIVTINNLYLKSIKYSLIILISHYISNIIMFLLFTNKYKFIEYIDDSKDDNTYNNALLITIKTLAIIFSNLIFITLLITLIKLLIPNNTIFKGIIIGLLEFSNGIIYISNLSLKMPLKSLIILIIISFGSISVFLQSISLNNKIKSIKFLFYKILNTLISIIIISVIILIMN
jgi:hypothetical protein